MSEERLEVSLNHNMCLPPFLFNLMSSERVWVEKGKKLQSLSPLVWPLLAWQGKLIPLLFQVASTLYSNLFADVTEQTLQLFFIFWSKILCKKDFR